MNSYLHLVSPRFFIQTSSLHTIASANLKHLSYLAYFRLSAWEVKRARVVWTQPDQNLPGFTFWFFALLLLKHFATANLRKLGLLTKNWILCLFAFLVVESSQKSVMIFKMLLYLEAYSLWGPWLKVSLKLIKRGCVPQEILR